jgi:CubicO group peptidase (beta-lactamase class C family)
MKTNAPSTAGFSADRLARASRILKDEITRGTMPGAVLMIGRRGHVVHLEAMGVQDPATGVAMRDDSIFRIYSMTKPVVAAAVMMLVEEGRIGLDDTLEKFVPAFAVTRVAQNGDSVRPSRPITIHDLLRHTSGFTFENLETPVQAQYQAVNLGRRDRTNKEFAETVATLPLLCHPGSEWNYGRSFEVLGYVVEVVTGQSLGEFLKQRLFAPLGMNDTGFGITAPDSSNRQAQAFAADGAGLALYDMMEKPRFESGGGGLVSTAPDYARFAEMMLNGGTLDGRRYLSRQTVRFMTSDHLDGAKVSIGPILPGFGFGLGVAVRKERGAAPFPGGIGQYFWNGIAGTQYWADPEENLWAVLMVQVRGQRERDYLRNLVRTIVYAALED